MSVPNEIDFFLVKLGDGQSPETFSPMCGIENVSINQTANTTDRNRRDCDKPNLPAQRRTKTTSVQTDVTGTGAINKDDIPTYQAALGIVRNYIIEGYQFDSTPGAEQGTLCGYYEGPFNLTATNMTADANGDSSGEITLASDGAVTWTPV